MKIGVQLPEVERPVTWPEVRDIALAAEAVGFDSVWVGDHLLYRSGEEATGPWEAWSILAALAAVTDRVLLGPLVAATAFHAPAMLAKKAATVDEISGGRLVLGLGAGWNRTEFDAFGFAYDHRASRFEESFTIIRRLLGGERFSFSGEYHEIVDAELVPGPRLGRPPIMIGSQGERVLRATLPHVESWNAWYAWFGNTPEGFGRMSDRIDDICRSVGRVPAEVERTSTVLVEAPGALGNAQRAERWDDPPAITGTPEEIAVSLLRFEDAGADHVQLVVDPITAESVEWLAPVVASVRRDTVG
jgi:alkanesulfonate monooxygenase SsuD/methylene tetrahydromethanopterin reductase-like flavin-dependent oxidoreductase (luciferase family)